MDWYRRGLCLAVLVMAVGLVSSCGLPAVDSAPPSISPPPAAAIETPTSPAPTSTAVPTAVASLCDVSPVVAPTPAEYPGYAQLDPSTGLHVTGNMQLIDLDTYRLRVSGEVEQPLELTYDEIRCLPKIEASPVLTCPGFFVDRTTWAGTPIAEVLALAKPQEGANMVKFVSADGYSTSLSLTNAFDRSNFLAYEWEGQPLPRLHGFPLRVVIPGDEGNQWTKWLVEIVVQ